MNESILNFVCDVLKRECNRRLARIEPGDPVDLRDILAAESWRCDDAATELRRLHADYMIALDMIGHLIVAARSVDESWEAGDPSRPDAVDDLIAACDVVESFLEAPAGDPS